MQPLVSVIMPAYNAEKFIAEAIESVLKQTYNNWELIIIDDCSTDDTLKIIQSYTDERIKVFCNAENKGVAETTNKAISICDGKYIALLDDDDIAENSRLSLQVDFLEQHPDIDILGGRITLVNDTGDIISYEYQPRNNPKYIKAVLLFSNLDFANSTAMIRKEFIQKNYLQYQNGCYGMQDYRFYIESSKIGNISSIDRFLLRHRLHDDNETERNFKNHGIERARKYAEFQRYSLAQSGFRLEETDLQLINKVMTEKDGKCESEQELILLHKVFSKLIDQAVEMNIDYLYELRHLCKVKLAEQLIKSDLFDKF